MNTHLIFYAHPNKKGFCGEFLRAVEEHMQKKGHVYEVIDLYAIGYDPIMKNEEHYTSGGYEIASENKIFQEKITQATSLIFIYPTWWQNMPAILKGFVDRVFTARYAFRYVNDLPVGLLKGRKAVVFTSSGGPRVYTRFFAGDRAVKVLAKDVLAFCGIKTKCFPIGGARKLTDVKKKNIEKLVQKGMKFLSL